MMEDDQQFCLRWNNHQSTLISVFDTLLENEKLVDCTLAAEGRIMKAHKVVLSACSPYFATLLQEQYDKHPIFILKDVKYQELRAMMDYMYRGEVNISQDQLAALLKAAESLQIKGLSDNRTGAPPRAEHQQQQQHHRGLNVPGGSKLSGGYTLEAQSKRARVGAGQLDTQDMSGSREGSSSPSRRRRKVRRRSIENVMAEPHDNSNSSQQQQSSLLQSNAGLAGVSAITAAATALASQLPSVVGSVATPGSTIATTQAIASAQQQQQQQQQPPQQQQQHQQQQQGQLMPTTTGVTKKTENVKGTTSDAMNTENVLCTVSGSAAVAVDADVMEQQQQHQQHHAKTDKQNHKQKQTSGGVAKDASEMVIEPKSEYDEEGNDETCEDLTLDDEDMGMDDLDQNAGTSQGGEGSSQGYAAWQHDRSQDEILLTQEAQQRDPQAKHDKSEQTDVTPEEFELDDCLLESNDIVITQNKDGFVLHVKKLGNITTAKLPGTDDEHSTTSTVVTSGQTHISDVQDISDVKPSLTTLTTSQTIKLPSTECELINLKKIIPASTTISTHPAHTATTIIQPQQMQQQHQQHHHHHHHHIQDVHHHAQVQSIVATHPGQSPQTINLVGLRNVQIAQHEPKPLLSRIKYSRGKIITPHGTTTANVQIVAQEHTTQHVEITEGTKYEINEIDLTNPNASEAMIRDLVKYAEIDDIQLEDGTKIGIGFAPSELTEHMQLATTTATITAVDETEMVTQHQHHHQQQLHLQSEHQQSQQQQHHHHITHHLLQEHDEATTSVEEIIPDPISVHDSQSATITKSYTILTTRPMKQESDHGNDSTTTYELSLSESLMSSQGDEADSKYICRHCGKRYRWKSTLRRHENVECGGKEPCHPCPYCSYKAKQRGNLGVHVRKHHPDKPHLESKRGRKI